jgi:hypothetical protein
MRDTNECIRELEEAGAENVKEMTEADSRLIHVEHEDIDDLLEELGYSYTVQSTTAGEGTKTAAALEPI